MRSILIYPERMHRSKLLLVLLALVLALAACSDAESDSGQSEGSGDADRLTVVAGFYPLEEAARRVGGDRVVVTGLTPPGGGPHDLELTPRDVVAVEQADVVVFLSKGFQPSVEQAVDGVSDDVTVVDALEGIELLEVQDGLEGTQGEVDGETLEGDFDPHVWVDPMLQSEIAATVAAALRERDPDQADQYEANLEAYRAELEELDGEFRAGLEDCESRTIVTSHRAFAYLAEAYELRQIPIAGVSPDDEPDPQSLEAIAQAAREDGVTVIFFESAVPKDLSETVAREIGAETDFLQPVETISQEDLDAGVDYGDIQRQNLASLVAGLRCS
jgi:zinc transport system substrate-binding protein